MRRCCIVVVVLIAGAEDAEKVYKKEHLLKRLLQERLGFAADVECLYCDIWKAEKIIGMKEARGNVYCRAAKDARSYIFIVHYTRSLKGRFAPSNQSIAPTLNPTAACFSCLTETL